MDSFLGKFFPNVLRNRRDRTSYCRFNDQILQLFTSSLYLAGLIASFFASWTTQKLGRRPSMLTGGCAFLVGGILNAAAQDLPMLIIGRIFLGIGVGFANQVSQSLFQLKLQYVLTALLLGALLASAWNCTVERSS